MKKSKQNVTKMPRRKDGMQHMNVAFEVKEIREDPDYYIFEGYGSTFGNVDLGDDVVMPGAFRDSLKRKMPIILWQHDRYEPIGMPEVITEDAKGLFLRVRLPKDDNLVSGRVWPQIKVGSIRTMSIGYRTIKSTYNEDNGIRELIELDLMEVSLVTFPMNPNAVLTGFKSLDEIEMSDEAKEAVAALLEENSMINVDQLKFLDEVDCSNVRELEKALCDSKLFSNRAAKRLACALSNVKFEEPEPDDSVKEALSGLLSKFDDNDAQEMFKSMLNKFEG
jgi:HK97 family phage prohead protease